MEIVNKFTKASVHVGVVSAFATSLFLVYGGIFSFSFLLIPLVAWARIKTRNHTKQQTIIGAIVGIAIILVSYVIFEYII
jgi:membrane-associated phospholipid phosphatase